MILRYKIAESSCVFYDQPQSQNERRDVLQIDACRSKLAATSQEPLLPSEHFFRLLSVHRLTVRAASE